jgi:hypothetical protein
MVLPILVLALLASAPATAGGPTRLDDDSDWWSLTRQPDVSTDDTKAQERGLDQTDFRLLGIPIDSEFEEIQAKLGTAAVVERGDAATGRQQLCYASRSGRVHVVFESGEINRAFYVFEGGQDWLGIDRCSKSSRINRKVATGSGLKLGMSPAEVRAVLGEPTRTDENRIVYWLGYKVNTPDDVLTKFRNANPAMTDAELLANYGHLDVGVWIEARFLRSRLNYLAVSKEEVF